MSDKAELRNEEEDEARPEEAEDVAQTEGSASEPPPASAKSSKPQHRGFAAMDQAKQREIASKGGKAAHEKGTAHEFSSEEARRAGQGGERVSKSRDHMATIGRKGGAAVSSNRSHMAEIGRKGGEAVSNDRDHMAAIGRKGEARGGDHR